MASLFEFKFEVAVGLMEVSNTLRPGDAYLCHMTNVNLCNTTEMR